MRRGIRRLFRWKSTDTGGASGREAEGKPRNGPPKAKDLGTALAATLSRARRRGTSGPALITA
eukprot:2748229-Alexandrium_andersonii.AAC.1